MLKYRLYHTNGCHLCEIAHQMLIKIIDEKQLELVDITTERHLMDRFQCIIPVFENISRNSQLKWPFEPSQIKKVVE
jgi:hypothetical protein